MIHVVGNAGVDTVFRVDRFPLPGETIVARDMAEDIGGKGANQAVVARRAGAKVSLIAAVGDDDAGARIRTILATEGVLIDGLAVWPGPTDRSSIYVDPAGENTIVSATNAARAFDPVAAGKLAGVENGDVVLCQGNLSVAVLVNCLRLARMRGATTVLNPSPLFPADDFDWSLVDIAVLNEVEAKLLSRSGDGGAGARALLAAGVGDVVLTLGERGAAMLGSDALEVPAPQVAAIDTTGAGDVFCGVLTAARADGASWSAALAAAAQAAAIAVTRRGVLASFPTSQEIAAIFSATESVVRQRGD
jgi:ribokinase